MTCLNASSFYFLISSLRFSLRILCSSCIFWAFNYALSSFCWAKIFSNLSTSIRSFWRASCFFRFISWIANFILSSSRFSYYSSSGFGGVVSTGSTRSSKDSKILTLFAGTSAGVLAYLLLSSLGLGSFILFLYYSRNSASLSPSPSSSTSSTLTSYFYAFNVCLFLIFSISL